jgi:hypothetical protein
MAACAGRRPAAAFRARASEDDVRPPTPIRFLPLVPIAAAAFSCGGAPPHLAGVALRTGLAALPNSASVYHSGGTLVGLGPGGGREWEVTLPEGATVVGRLAVAPNSTVYARGRLSLHAVDHDGALLWTVPLPEPPSSLGREAMTPASFGNSTVAVLETPKRLRCFGLDGVPLWAADLPAGEANGAPASTRSGLVLFPTTAGVHAFAADGRVVWTWKLP